MTTTKADIRPRTVYRLNGTVHEVFVMTYPHLVWVDTDGFVHGDRPKVRLDQVQQATWIDGEWHGLQRPFGAPNGWLRNVLPRDLIPVEEG